MRPTAILFAAFALAATVALAWVVGAGSTERIERTTRTQTSAALSAAGALWVDLEIDGLQVRLAGQAPDQAEHLRVLEILSRLVGTSRLEDTTTIAARTIAATTVFRLEILRSGGNISLIGQVPEPPGSDQIVSTTEAIPGVTGITNLLATTKAQPPEGWSDTLNFGLDAIWDIRQGRIILETRSAEVTAATDSEQQKQALETALRANAPQGMALSLNISAPPPVISPFVLSFELANGSARLTACTAGTEDGRARILSAVRRAGVIEAPGCRIGLGSPSLHWPRAADLAIAALEQMRGGTLQISDTEISLSAPDGFDSDTFENLAADLRSTLPPPFSLRVIQTEKPPAASTTTEIAPTLFVAELAADGTVGLSGPVRDTLSDQAVMTYAASLFGFGKITGTLQQQNVLPDGWPGRILTGLETLSLLNTGRVEISPDGIAVSGVGASEDIALEVSDVLRLRLGGSDAISVDVRFDPALMPPETPRLLPAQCATRIASILQSGQITFEPNATDIEADSIPIIDAIAEILRQCPQARFEIGGHTDSQGREVLNTGLSQSRADAVLDALLSREVLIVELTARGYGESQPIADNNTEEGRQQNRRIAFKLLEGTDESD